MRREIKKRDGRRTDAHALIAAVFWDGVELLLEGPGEGREAENVHGYALLHASASIEVGETGVARIHLQHDGWMRTLALPYLAARSSADRSASRTRAHLGRRRRRDWPRRACASRLRWRRIACGPLGRRTCEHGGSGLWEVSGCEREVREMGGAQESGIVVRGGGVWRRGGVESVGLERAFEVVESHDRVCARLGCFDGASIPLCLPEKPEALPF